MSAGLLTRTTFPPAHRGKCAHDGTWGAWGYDPDRDLPFRECEAGGCRQWGKWCRACGGNGETAHRDEFGNYETGGCGRCDGTGRSL